MPIDVAQAVQKRITGNWQKGEYLGNRSSDLVYEGISEDGSFFAVKEVSPGNQLEKEIAFLSQFEHENIVKYIGTEMEQDQSKLYVFLELVHPGSLQELYKDYTIRDPQASSYTRQILHGLNYLHDRNIAHRGIKCSNILVDENGSAKLADFGWAKAIELNGVKSFQGTTFWKAPEVVSEGSTRYGLPADIWSLGCTVLEMLTGKNPYYPLKWEEALSKLRDREPPLVPDSLSIYAQDFIWQCLEVNPDERPTAAQLLDHVFVQRSLPQYSGSASPYICSIQNLRL